jgi:hypothetical protein
MLGWLTKVLQRLPRQVGNVLLHNTLTGLRPSENILCIKLIHTDFENYANEELGYWRILDILDLLRKRQRSHTSLFTMI